MFEHHKEKELEKAETKWENVEKYLEDILTIAKTVKPSAVSSDLILKKGEGQYFSLTKAHLIEARRAPQHRVGAYGGPTVRVGKVPIHMGAFYATQTAPRPDVLTTVDSGVCVITNKRVSFMGQRYSKTVQLIHLVDFDDDPSDSTVTLHSESSAKSIGLYYGNAKLFTIYLQIAISDANGTKDQLISQWEKDVENHKLSKPKMLSGDNPPVTDKSKPPEEKELNAQQDQDLVESLSKSEKPTANLSDNKALDQSISNFPPGWYQDPYKKAQYRWWNGLAWTSYSS